MISKPLKVFPADFDPITKSVAYGSRVALTKLFDYACIFLLIMYVIYCIIRKFVPKKILFFKVRQPLLDLTPLYELRVTGIFPLMDRLVNVVFSKLPFSKRIYGVFWGVGNFIRGSIGYVQSMVVAKGNRFVKQSTGGANVSSMFDSGQTYDEDVTTKPNPKAIPSRKNAKANRVEPYPEDDNEDVTSPPPNPRLDSKQGQPEPIDKPDRTKSENIYIEKEYNQCIERQYLQITPNMSYKDRLITKAKNNRTAINCGVQKIQAIGKAKDVITAKQKAGK
jgi:hypothetical protein